MNFGSFPDGGFCRKLPEYILNSGCTYILFAGGKQATGSALPTSAQR